ncbi:VanZ family protein [Paenibacillus sp. LjRoot56]|uniref:VanZ family protein n=1 Tax=Paenibacillus sp. LjRoot56 TaxID=3342333 RepID=UPI003ECF4F47
MGIINELVFVELKVIMYIRQGIKSFILFGVFLISYIFLFLLIFLFKYVSPLELFSPDRIYYRSVDVIPFYTIYSYLSGELNVSPIIVMTNILGNIILFMPLGVYVQLLKKDKKISISMGIVFLISLLVEIFQFIFGIGATDIDDIILNSLGGLIGILVYKVLLLIFKDEEKVRLTIVVTGLIVILFAITFKAILFYILGIKIRLLP